MNSWEWSNDWYKGDSDDGYGLDYWGPSTVYEGTIWCNGTGDQVDGGGYDIRMNSFLKSRPIDVSQYTDLELRYRFLCDIDPGYNFDNFTVKYSYNESYWYTDNTYKEIWSGWIEASKLLRDTNYIYLDFTFQSGYDNMYSPYSRGVYIDRVEIWGQPFTKADITYTTPNGWDDPIVVSSKSGTHTNDVVYADEPIYIDWAFINNGDYAAGGVSVDILIDDNIVQQVVFPLVDIGEEYNWDDTMFVLPEGWHTVRMVLDTFNIIVEHDETNNIYEKTFYCEAPEITFTGILQYEYIDQPFTKINPLANIKVQLVDYDFTSGDDVLAEDTTESDGSFTLGPIDNSEPLQGRQDLYLKMFAENDAVYVTIGYSDDVYAYKTPHTDNMLSGVYDDTLVVPIPVSANFYIADYIKEIRDEWFELTWRYPDTIHVVNNEDSYNSYYNGGVLKRMTIAGKIDNDSLTPDYFDKSIIAHEYGHHLTDGYQFFNASVGVTHSWDAQITSGLAADEGFATFWSCYFQNDSIYRDYNNNNEYFWVNCENGEFGYSNYSDPLGSANNYGEICEGAVAGILWDIYDVPEDDYSTYLYIRYYPQSNYPQFGKMDSIGDTLTDGIGNILSTLLDRNVGGDRPDNISEFWNAWFQSPSFDHIQAMKDIWYEHGILITNCCIGSRGNIDGDQQDNIDISDLLYLVAFMFQGGAALPCFEEADLNGSGGIDIADLVYIIDFMFRGGSTPIPCY